MGGRGSGGDDGGDDDVDDDDCSSSSSITLSSRHGCDGGRGLLAWIHSDDGERDTQGRCSRAAIAGPITRGRS